MVTHERPWRRAVVAAVAVAAVASVLYALALRPWLARETSDGPLETNHDSNGSSYSSDVREVVSFGLSLLTNTGSEDVVLESAELLGSGDMNGVVVRPAETVPEGNELVAADRGYPPRWEESKPSPRAIAGTVVRPGEGQGIELLFAITPLRKGRFDWTGLRVRYRVGDKRYVLTDADDSFSLCVPRVEWCEPYKYPDNE